MADLKAQLENARCENADFRSFIPYQPLRQLMTADAIRTTLKKFEFKPYRLDEVTQRIKNSGIKIFAILTLIDQVLLVTQFIEVDQLHDRKLPFELCSLEKDIIPDYAKKFHERQWELTAPEFFRGTLTKSLHGRVILPFTKDKRIGSGGFGDIYEIEIHPKHQPLDIVFRNRLVRKELTDVNGHRVELENLSILNHLKHSSILELLTSYTYKEKHNLVFPLAESGTLSDLLTREREETDFKSNETFLIALAGLSSGIEHVHNFVESRINLSLIGCHHDLRPQNILVSDVKLILADFGLSRFKDSSESSRTSFKIGGGDYLAPECEDINGDFEKLDVRRSSDIWSFGCILAEVTTYMSLGPSEVSEFKKRRKFKIGPYTFSCFHCGRGKGSNEVEVWLARLEETASRPFKMLVNLVRRMLSLNEADRPKASLVTATLRFITLLEVIESTEKSFEESLADCNSLDARLEYERFKGWSSAIGIPGCGVGLDLSHGHAPRLPVEFESTLDYLFRVRDHLKSLLSQGVEGNYPVFLPLHHLNDHLNDLLDGEQQEKSRAYFKVSVIGADNGPSAPFISESENLSLDTEIRMRLTLKQMTKFAEKHSETDMKQLQLDSAAVKIGERFGSSNLGWLNDGRDQRQVLVEWRQHPNTHVDETANKELFLRVERLAMVLSLEKPKDIRALHCLGFFHDPSRYAFGIIFDLPEATKEVTVASIKPVSLNRRIADTPMVANQPFLEEKFFVAFTLAKSVMEFHLVGWLHKSLTSSNVIFFPAVEQRYGPIQQPYIIGFNHSRPDDQFAFTEGPASLEKYYQHPQYLKNARGYHSKYDYYSLGIILLEIGHWKPLNKMFKSLESLKPEEVQQKILASRIPLLGQTMGMAYRDAVKVCIEGDFGRHVSKDKDVHTTKSLHLAFERLVITPLTRCWSQLVGSRSL